MAFGTHCKYCWWQEVDHYPEGECDADLKPNEIKNGYTHSLDTCPGFEPDSIASEYTEVLGLYEETGEKITHVDDFNSLQYFAPFSEWSYGQKVIRRAKAHHLTLQGKIG